MNTVMNLRFPQNASDVLIKEEIIGFKRLMLHGATCELHRHVRK